MAALEADPHACISHPTGGCLGTQKVAENGRGATTEQIEGRLGAMQNLRIGGDRGEAEDGGGMGEWGRQPAARSESKRGRGVGRRAR
jgi:hypothetical protein